MSDDLEFRKVGDRIITEKQYQSEQNTEQLMGAADSFSVITMPASIFSGLAMFVYLFFNAWSGIDSTFALLLTVFLDGLIAFIVAFIVYLYLIPGLILGAIVVACLFGDKLFFNETKQSSAVSPAASVYMISNVSQFPPEHGNGTKI